VATVDHARSITARADCFTFTESAVHGFLWCLREQLAASETSAFRLATVKKSTVTAPKVDTDVMIVTAFVKAPAANAMKKSARKRAIKRQRHC
jgi:hypothetical protein